MSSTSYQIVVSQEELIKLPYEVKLRAKAFIDDYQLLKDDPTYQSLRLKVKKAKKELEEYSFNKRHNQ